MAFPATKLVLMVELALGADLTSTDPSTWTWTDISQYVKFADGITITRGRADEFSTAGPSKATLTLLNDGRFVIRNPVGAYYGTIGRNTPLRVMVRLDLNPAADAFGRTTSNGFGTADTGGAWTVVGTASDYQTTGTVARVTHTAAASRHYATLAATSATFDQTVRIRTAALATGAPLSAGMVFRYVDSSNTNRAEMLFNTDATVTVREVNRLAGTDTVAFSTVVAGLTHVANTFYWLRVQYTRGGTSQTRIKAWLDGTTEPTTWAVAGSISAPATTGMRGLTSNRETGNTNSNATVDFDDYAGSDGWYVRHTGFVDEWPTRWNDAGLKQMLAPITASGMLRRLQQGRPARSAVKAGVLSVSGFTPRQYWPVEDGSGSTQIGSALDGFPPMQVSGSESLGAGQAAGSDPLMVAVNTGRIAGRVPTYTGTDWTMMWLTNIPAATAAPQALLQWNTTGTYPLWQLVLTPQAGPDLLTLQAYDSGSVERLGDTGANFVDATYGQQVWVEVNAQQVGGDIHWEYQVFPFTTPGLGFGKIGTKVSATAGTVNKVGFGAGSGADQLAGTILGHIVVWDTVAVLLGTTITFAQEATTARWQRLGWQERVAMRVTAALPAGMPDTLMGTPATAPLLTQMRDVETVEQGILFDDLDSVVALQPRSIRYNQTVALTLDVAQRQVYWPLEPADDDQQLHNTITVTRTGGSSYTATDTTSPVAATRAGYYPLQVNAGLAYDGDLPYDAARRLVLGTVDEIRYPTVPIDFTRNPSLIPAWVAAPIGSRMQVTNAPALLTPDTIDLILEGYVERFDTKRWTAVCNTSSARPWNVFQIGGSGNLGRLDSGATTLHQAYNSGATSMQVDVVGPLWTTGATSTDIEIAGERLTVTNVAGSGSPQTLTVTRSINGVVKDQASGATVKLWRGPVIAR